MTLDETNLLPQASEVPIDPVSLIAGLSPRCREVLRGIAAGHSNKVIAHDLGISPRTVEVHRARLMQKLRAHHVADALRVAYEAVRILEHAPPDPCGEPDGIAKAE